MTLNARFLVLITTLLLGSSLAILLVLPRVTEGIVEQWGLRLVETQVRYDSARLLHPVEREIALARRLAESPALRDWLRQPEQAQRRAAALAELEGFRRHFREHNYFVARSDSGAYYHNDAANRFAGRQLRYHLATDNPADAWFYRLVERDSDFHLNVNPDLALGVTQLWIDIPVRDGGRTLGIVGTGLNLAPFLRDTVDLDQPGITTLFADHSGAIQLHRDPRIIDYASLVKPEGAKNTVDLLLDDPRQRRQVRALLDELRQAVDARQVRTAFVDLAGQRHLMGIAYLPSIDWYEITLLDLSQLVPASSFAPLAVVLCLTLLVALLLVHRALRRHVLHPLGALHEAIRRLGNGALAEVRPAPGHDEIGGLLRHFEHMAAAIRDHTEALETKVQTRTAELHRQARCDALTGLDNRRGMEESLLAECERSRRQGSRFGVLWLDLDHFKSLNDSAGHAAGDRALQLVAQVLQSGLRPYDRVARWGGDEFLACLSPCDATTLASTAERMRLAIDAQARAHGLPISASIGATLAEPGEAQERTLQRADQALYRVKQSGRNRVLVDVDSSTVN